MLAESSRRSPSLPQNDSPAQQQKRAKQLLDAKGKYIWNDQVVNLVGVPMSATVPETDQPTLEWKVLILEALVKVGENLLAIKVNDELGWFGKKLPIQNRLESVKNLVEKAKNTTQDGLESSFARVALMAEIAIAFGEIKLEEAKLLHESAQLHETAQASAPDLQDYNNLFKAIAIPQISTSFQNDQVFARLRVAGPNPMLLKGIASLPDRFPVSELQYQQVMGNADSLAKAGSEGRLYLLDFSELNYLVENPGLYKGKPKYVYAPFALFAVPVAGQSLTPVAIQCGQDPAKFPVFLKPAISDASAQWGWEMAKMVVQTADTNYLELFVHLARTHLLMEAFAMATYRCLAPEHPLHVLLLPHFEGTLSINDKAASTLLAPDSINDHLFGTPVQCTQKAAGADRLAYDFYQNMLPAELAARNVGNAVHLPDYPYRDDALLAWGAIHQWVTEYVSIYYSSDAQVVGDTELAAWTASLMAENEGSVKGFKSIADRAQLVEVLTMVIFTASAQHSAANFPQKGMMMYAPMFSGAGWTQVPEAGKEYTQRDWLAMLPSLPLGIEQINLLSVLGSIYYRRLGDYRSNYFPYPEWFEDHNITGSDGPLARFKNALLEVEATINARNLRRPAPYPYLLPSQIAQSITI
ncbi:lipoxygenase family protein [Undibacterium sp. TJN25]|uniref:lipoxygenase family protein n=1 Tax=Undibacterium sp. TJN25 TaxID=3413056 RepID=UPI003BF3508F